VLTQASLLGSIKASNRSVHRGLFVLREVLCGEVPPPPDGIVTTPPSPEYDTERKLADYRASQGTCGGCHAAFDGIGLSFERYDALGRYQAADTQGAAVDASGKLTLDGASVTFSDITELAALLAESPQVHTCLTRKLAGHALTGKVNARCAEPVVAAASEQGGALLDVFRAIAQVDSFKQREVSP
jgi:hypothetical protein